MNVLIRMTEFLKENEANNEVKNEENHEINNDLLTLLLQKIEDSVLKNKPICIVMTNSFISCKNKIFIDDYEIDKEHLYLSYENFELYINFDSFSRITYENQIDEYFMIAQNNMEFNIYFM